jgi:hypothetical protein
MFDWFFSIVTLLCKTKHKNEGLRMWTMIHLTQDGVHGGFFEHDNELSIA